jgi:hypothetical protein
MYLRDAEEERIRIERAKHEMHAPLRGLLLREYVEKIRSTYHNEKRQEKLKKIHEATSKMKEQKEQLQEARMKALDVTAKAKEMVLLDGEVGGMATKEKEVIEDD